MGWLSGLKHPLTGVGSGVCNRGNLSRVVVCTVTKDPPLVLTLRKDNTEQQRYPQFHI